MALVNYNELKDIKRCILNTHNINAEWLVRYMSRLDPAWCLECAGDLLRHNRQNL